MQRRETRQALEGLQTRIGHLRGAIEIESPEMGQALEECQPGLAHWFRREIDLQDFELRSGQLAAGADLTFSSASWFGHYNRSACGQYILGCCAISVEVRLRGFLALERHAD